MSGTPSIAPRLRPTLPEDAETIIRWLRPYADGVLWWGPELPDVPERAWLVEQFADPGRRYLTMIDDTGGICGIFALTHDPMGQRLHIGRLAVAPGLRGQGLGTFMIEHAIAQARDIGAAVVTLYVSRANRAALRLYQRLGFRAPPDGPAWPARADAGTAMELRLEPKPPVR